MYFFHHCGALLIFGRRYTATTCLLEPCWRPTKSHQPGHWLGAEMHWMWHAHLWGVGVCCASVCDGCVEQENGWRNHHTSIPSLTFPSLILADILVKYICVIEAKSRRKRDSMCQLFVYLHAEVNGTIKLILPVWFFKTTKQTFFLTEDGVLKLLQPTCQTYVAIRKSTEHRCMMMYDEEFDCLFFFLQYLIRHFLLILEWSQSQCSLCWCISSQYSAELFSLLTQQCIT